MALPAGRRLEPFLYLYILGFVNSYSVALYCNVKVARSAVAVAAAGGFWKPTGTKARVIVYD